MWCVDEGEGEKKTIMKYDEGYILRAYTFLISIFHCNKNLFVPVCMCV